PDPRGRPVEAGRPPAVPPAAAPDGGDAAAATGRAVDFAGGSACPPGTDRRATGAPPGRRAPAGRPAPPLGPPRGARPPRRGRFGTQAQVTLPDRFHNGPAAE